MKSVYFVRHAQPDHAWEDDRTRPLTEDGLSDREKVTDVLRGLSVDAYISSPYKRSVDTISQSALEHRIKIVTDERFRERRKGPNGNEYGMFQKRWNDFNYHEPGGESLNMVQKRNIEALTEILRENGRRNIVLGTHGTALSTILNYYDPSYHYESFIRIIDYMPYIIRLDFEGTDCTGREELLIVKKEFTGAQRADKA